MANQDPLIDYHILQHTEELRSVMLNHSVDEIYGLMTTLLPAAASKLTAQLDAVQRRALLDRLEDLNLAELILSASTTDFYAIIVMLNDERIARLLRAVDGKNRIRLKRLLENRANTVSTRMSSNYLACSVLDSIEHTLSRIARTRPSGTEPIYVVDDSGRLVGEIDPYLLIQHRGGTETLQTLAQKTSHLQTGSHLQSVAKSALWNGKCFLPVVDLEDRLVGTLSIHTLDLDDANVRTPMQLPLLIGTEFIRLLADISVTVFGSRQE